VAFDDLFERLAPAEPDHPKATRSDEWREYLREMRNLRSRFVFIIGRLLDRGQVAAVDPKTGVQVLTILRAETGGCDSRVVYRTMGGDAFFELEPALP
jgi:hypothetical protein